MATPNFLLLEYVRQEPYRDQAMREHWPVEEGRLKVPDRPGLGVQLDEKSLLSNPMRSGGGRVARACINGERRRAISVCPRSPEMGSASPREP